MLGCKIRILFYPANKKCNQPPSASDSAVASPASTPSELTSVRVGTRRAANTEPLRDPRCLFFPFFFFLNSGSLGGGGGATDGG